MNQSTLDMCTLAVGCAIGLTALRACHGVRTKPSSTGSAGERRTRKVWFRMTHGGSRVRKHLTRRAGPVSLTINHRLLGGDIDDLCAALSGSTTPQDARDDRAHESVQGGAVSRTSEALQSSHSALTPAEGCSSPRPRDPALTPGSKHESAMLLPPLKRGAQQPIAFSALKCLELVQTKIRGAQVDQLFGNGIARSKSLVSLRIIGERHISWNQWNDLATVLQSKQCSIRKLTLRNNRYWKHHLGKFALPRAIAGSPNLRDLSVSGTLQNDLLDALHDADVSNLRSLYLCSPITAVHAPKLTAFLSLPTTWLDSLTVRGKFESQFARSVVIDGVGQSGTIFECSLWDATVEDRSQITRYKRLNLRGGIQRGLAEIDAAQPCFRKEVVKIIVSFLPGCKNLMFV